jgi:hypothetical protein
VKTFIIIAPLLGLALIVAGCLSGCTTAPVPVETVSAGKGLAQIATEAVSIAKQIEAAPDIPQKPVIAASAAVIKAEVPVVSEAVKQLTAQVQKLTKENQDLREEANSWFVIALRGLGLLAIILAGFKLYAAYMTGGVGLLASSTSALALVAGGVGLLGLSFLLEAAWFKTLCIWGTVVVVVSIVAFLAYDYHRKAKVEVGEKESDTVLAKLGKLLGEASVTAVNDSALGKLINAVDSVLTDEEKRGIKLLASGQKWE